MSKKSIGVVTILSTEINDAIQALIREEVERYLRQGIITQVPECWIEPKITNQILIGADAPEGSLQVELYDGRTEDEPVPTP